MWLTAGVVASLRGIGRGEECRCDTECESEGRRASEQRGARGPSVTGAALTGSALGSERPGLDERMMRRAADCLGNKVTPSALITGCEERVYFLHPFLFLLSSKLGNVKQS